MRARDGPRSEKHLFIGLHGGALSGHLLFLFLLFVVRAMCFYFFILFSLYKQVVRAAWGVLPRLPLFVLFSLFRRPLSTINIDMIITV